MFVAKKRKIMKHILPLLLLLFPLVGFAQFIDNFSDENFTANPEWVGDVDKFIVNVSHELQLNDSSPSSTNSTYLATTSEIIDNASWEFTVRMSFNPSGSNYCDVFLVSNTSNLNNVSEGYFVRIGYSYSGASPNSTKAVNLHRKNSANDQIIIQGIADRINSNNNNVRVKVTRDSDGNWKLFSDISGGTAYQLEGETTDDTYKNSNFFGVKCIYNTTTGRSTGFYFKNFIVESFIDNEPPSIIEVSSASANEINVRFSEPVNIETAKNVENYSLNNGYQHPDLIYETPNMTNTVTLHYNTNFNDNDEYTLTVKGIADLYGNVMKPQEIKLVFLKEHDIIISEIMARAEPPVLLPNAKYVELYNRSNTNVNISSWRFSLGTTTRNIPDYIINAKSYVILCNPADVEKFTEIGIENVLGVPNFTLNVSAGILTLRNKDNKIIHTVSYTDSWINDNFKKRGGYSLEMIDLNNPCGQSENWTGSTDPRGGTPGIKNSTVAENSDKTPPYPVAAEIIDDDTVVLYFSETLLEKYAKDKENFSITEFENQKPIWISAKEPDFSVISMKFENTFEVGKPYTLNIATSIKDCVGNPVNSNTSIIIAIAKPVDRKDIVINEILFNPYTGEKSFIEIYNRSDKILDLKQLYLSNHNSRGEMDNTVQISTISHLLFPEQYCAITTDIESLYKYYTVLIPENLFQTKSIPTTPNAEGTVILSDRYINIIDEVNYTEKQHFQLLSNKKGVSLERINFDRPSDDLSNWHSASQAAGFATPGYKNSQYSSEIISTSTITLSSPNFSPDNDGEQDRLTINYKLNEPGYVATMAIYSSNGMFVTNIADNEMLGIEGNLFWDGFDKANNICPMGIYILYVEMYNITSGKKIMEKHSVVLNKKK